VAIDTRPPSYIDQLIKTLEREAIAIHARLGTPGLLGLLVVLGFLWRWRANVRLLQRLQPGTPGMAEETQAIEQAALRATGYRERLRSWLDWLSARLSGAHPWGPGTYRRMLALAVIYPIAGVLIVWAITGENTSGIPGLLPEFAVTQRWLSLTVLILVVFAWQRSMDSDGWSQWIWFAGAFAVAVAGAFVVASAVAVTIVFVGAFAGAFAIAGAVAFVGAGAVAGASAVSGA